MEHLDSIINELLRTHVGGQTFFDELDERVRNNNKILHNIVNKIASITNWDCTLIVSGKFGEIFYDFMKYYYGGIKVLKVPGGLRTMPEDTILPLIGISAKNFIFVDDSYYSGKTESIIRNSLSSIGAKLNSTVVIYDGSKHKRTDLFSLYQYYSK